jgi:hypothetical protein
MTQSNIGPAQNNSTSVLKSPADGNAAKIFPPPPQKNTNTPNSGASLTPHPTTIIECISLKDGCVVKTFGAVKDAAKWANMKSNGINKVLRRENQSGGGFFWRSRDVYGPDVLAAIIAAESRKEAGLAPDFKVAHLPTDIDIKTMTAEGWIFDKTQNKYIGGRLRVFLDDYGYSDGTVIAYLSGEKNKSRNGLEQWCFQHDNGEVEQLDEEEIKKFTDYFIRGLVDDPENPENSISNMPRDTGRRNNECDCRVECFTPQGVALMRFESAPKAASMLENILSVRTIMKCCRTEKLEHMGVCWRWCFNNDTDDPIENPIALEDLKKFMRKNFRGKPVYNYRHDPVRVGDQDRRNKKVARQRENSAPKRYTADSSFLRKGTSNERTLAQGGNPADLPVPRKIPSLGLDYQVEFIPECRPMEHLKSWMRS